MSKPKLHYFNGRGRAETLRLLFAANGIDFEDVRIERPQWADLKPKSPFGTVPYVEVDGKCLGQTCAIESYIVEKHGLEKKYNAHDIYQINLVVEQAKDMFQALAKIFFLTPEAERPAAIEKYKTETFKQHLSGLAKMLGTKPPGTARGEKPSRADLYVFWVSETLPGLGLDKEFCGQAAVKACLDAVTKDANIKKYLAARPKTDF